MDRAAQIQFAYELCFQRKPTPGETAKGKALMLSMEQKHQLSPDRALEPFCVFVLNLNEFIYLE